MTRTIRIRFQATEYRLVTVEDDFSIDSEHDVVALVQSPEAEYPDLGEDPVWELVSLHDDDLDRRLDFD